MKIINLLNKIANEEELPKRIKYKDKEFELHYADDEEELPYYIGNEFVLINYINNFYQLNEEIEIIQDSEYIDIQNIEENYSCNPREDVNQENINLLIKAVKQLDNKINKKG